MNAVTHLEKVITGEVSAVTHLEKVIAGETSAVTYTEKVITGEATPITHLQKVIAGVESPVTHLEYVWAGGSPTPTEHEYTGAVPYTFRADGSPLISWRISGNTVQNGTPTPDNPVMPQGCGNKTANLFDGSIEQGTLNENAAIGTSYNDTKSIPTAAINPYRVRVTNPIYIDRELTFSIDFNSYQMYVLFFDENQKYTGSHSSSWRNSPLTLSGEYIGKYIGLVVKSKQSGNVPISPTDDIKLMLSSGSTALPYEPFGVKIPISSANTTTPVYLGEVETTRKIKKLVLDETSNFTSAAVTGGLAFVYNPVPYPPNKWSTADNIISSHYKSEYSNKNGNIYFTTARLIIVDFRFETVDAFKAYLAQQYAAGTPVTVWYVLATEETAVVNEPLMKIGEYADTLSMEQAGVSIPTNNGSTTVDVDTTLKPSEVYIKYKGV